MANAAPRGDVIRALKAHGVFVGNQDNSINLYALEKGEFLEMHVLQLDVPMYLLNYFKRKLDIPIHHFWNPDQAEQEQANSE